MALVVQKYGGTSVAGAERLKAVARRVAGARAVGDQVVVVVSAMGDATDSLLGLAHQVSSHPTEREMDMLLATGEIVSSTLLAMALNDLGCPALSLTGAQAGIWTDASHRRARILVVEAHRLLKEMEAGRVVVVAGFQGITREMEVTTLGRGGSDTTAVALAAGLGAGRCEIYTDVEGVFTADPHLVPEARPMADIGYEEMMELATYGAKVLHPRAVELGWLYQIQILVASSFSQASGTLIHGGGAMEIRNKVRGIAHDMDVAKITVAGVPDRPGIAAAVFEPLARADVSVDTIVQNASVENITDLTFTVACGDLAKSLDIIKEVLPGLGARELLSDSGLAKVSIVGSGIQNTPGYAARMFRVLAQEGINIQLITTSEIRITCIIDEDKVREAVGVLHHAFEMEKAGD
jgi:aspartate kinase